MKESIGTYHEISLFDSKEMIERGEWTILQAQNNNFHIIAKPSGPLCNLDCNYCFYTEKEVLFTDDSPFKMSDQTLEVFIKNYIAGQDAPEVPFVWQGGEPTLVGIDFYKKVIQFQQKYARGKKITNSLQTNGTLLNEEWCEFLAEHHFLIGLSLDGPPSIHDTYRVDRGGRPTSHKVLRALRLIQEYEIDYNILTCVTHDSSKRATEIYDYFKEIGVQYVQFIPIVERLPNTEANKIGLRHAVPPVLVEKEEQSAVSSWSVGSEAYGDFLIEVFDQWVRSDVGKMFIMNFEWAFNTWLGLPSPICIFSETCGNAGMIEHNGDVYACDHFMYPHYKLGNVYKDPLKQLMNTTFQEEFGRAKKETLPTYCQRCDVRFACNGECPKNRFLTTPDGEPGLNYLCAGYKKYFRYIHPYLKVMRQLLEHDLPVADVMNVIKGPIVLKR